ncbi:MAG: glycosyltransferase family 4 protein [bacterium]
MNKNKILILVPDLFKPGGIANYYKVIRNYFTIGIDFFNRGTKVKSISKYVDFVFDLINFILVVLENKHLIFIINNSTGQLSFFRDYQFIKILRFLNKRYIIFFRGWSDESAEYIIKQNKYKRALENSSALIVLSKEFKTKLRKWGIKQPIYIETTAFDDDLIKNISMNVPKKNKQINLLFLARVEKTKGIYELLDAYKLLKSKFPFLTLTIAGDGSVLKDVKLQVKEKNLQNIKFTGYVKSEKKKEIFLKSDIYIFPSFHGEGMPNSVLEAMAFGLPVITRSVGGLKDFFEDGRMGFMTESKAPAALAKLIEKLISNQKLIAEISDYNKNYAKKNFMASNVAKRTEKIYSEVLEGTAHDSSWQDTN